MPPGLQVYKYPKLLTSIVPRISAGNLKGTSGTYPVGILKSLMSVPRPPGTTSIYFDAQVTSVLGLNKAVHGGDRHSTSTGRERERPRVRGTVFSVINDDDDDVLVKLLVQLPSLRVFLYARVPRSFPPVLGLNRVSRCKTYICTSIARECKYLSTLGYQSRPPEVGKSGNTLAADVRDSDFVPNLSFSSLFKQMLCSSATTLGRLAVIYMYMFSTRDLVSLLKKGGAHMAQVLHLSST